MTRLWPLLFLLAMPIMAAVPSPPTGVGPRTCGFDMDDDGIIGEASDDCNVCDGSTTDPDGDGDDEDINYVDSATGVDDASCGAANDPCATLDYVLAGTNSSYAKYADGASSDPEDIICIKGTITQSTDKRAITIDGGTGTYTAAYESTDLNQWGSGGNSHFEYPEDPFMIVGWDADNDGSYPPEDTDDTAVLTCDQGGGTYTDMMFELQNSYFELAHLTLEECGYDFDTEDAITGLLRWEDNATNSHHHIHDLSIERVNYDAVKGSNQHIFYGFGDGTLSWISIEHNDMLDIGGYTFRGGDDDENSDFKIHYNYVRHWCNDDGAADDSSNSCTFHRTWNKHIRRSVSYNHIDYNVGNWGPANTNSGLFWSASTCNQSMWVRGNYTVDFPNWATLRPLVEDGSYPGCSSPYREMQDIIIEDNYHVRNNAATTKANPVGYWFRVHERTGVQENACYLEDLMFRNNIFVNNSTHDGEYAMVIHGGNGTDTLGTYTFVGNTYYGATDTYTKTAVQFSDDVAETYNADVVFKDNIIDLGPSAVDDQMEWSWSDATFDGDGNVWDTSSTADWSWLGTAKNTLADWQTASGATNDKACDPSYTNISTGDFHLQSGDTCAKDEGVSISAYTSVDYDGDSRNQGSGWDIGADEYDEGESATITVTGVTVTGVTID